MPRAQRQFRELAATHHAVHVLVDQIHLAVAGAEIELDIGIARLESRQGRYHDQAGQWRRHIHAQAPTRCVGRSRQAGLGIVQVGEQAHDPFVVRGAIGGDVDLACGAVEQLHSQMRFQLLHQLRHTRLARMQRFGGLGEAAGFRHADEGLHRVDTVHVGSTGGGIVLILQTVIADSACLSRRLGCLE